MIKLFKAKLTSEARNDLPSSAFVFPSKRAYPIHDLSHARNALARSSGKPEEATVRAAVHRKYPQLRDSAQKREDLEVEVPLWKDDAAQIVYGVVLEPDLVDVQGDQVTPQEIEKAAHDFLVTSREMDVQHDGNRSPDLRVVESFIAPQDLEIAGEPVQKGAWVLAAHVADPQRWQEVRDGTFTGWSMEGSAFREAVEV